MAYNQAQPPRGRGLPQSFPLHSASREQTSSQSQYYAQPNQQQGYEQQQQAYTQQQTQAQNSYSEHGGNPYSQPSQPQRQGAPTDYYEDVIDSYADGAYGQQRGYEGYGQQYQGAYGGHGGHSQSPQGQSYMMQHPQQQQQQRSRPRGQQPQGRQGYPPQTQMQGQGTPRGQAQMRGYPPSSQQMHYQNGMPAGRGVRPTGSGPQRGNPPMQMRSPPNGQSSYGGQPQARMGPQGVNGDAPPNERPGPKVAYSRNQQQDQYQHEGQRHVRPPEPRRPLIEPHSPVSRSYDNPFPVFPTRNNGPAQEISSPVERTSPPEQMQRPGTAPGTRPKDLYVEQRQPPMALLNRPGPERSRSNEDQEEQQWQEMPTHDGYYGPPTAEFMLPARPGSAPGERTVPTGNGDNGFGPRPPAHTQRSIDAHPSDNYVEADSFPVYEMAAGEAPRSGSAMSNRRQLPPPRQGINWASQPGQIGGPMGHSGGPQLNFNPLPQQGYGGTRLPQAQPLPQPDPAPVQRQASTENYYGESDRNARPIGAVANIRSESRNRSLPDRSRVERPAFYPAAGEPTGGVHIAVPSVAAAGPDRLPAHPTPAPRGRQQPPYPGAGVDTRSASQPPKPPPVRQYSNNSVEVARPSMDRPSTAPQSRSAGPLTQQDLARLRDAANANPADSKLQLTLAQKLVEASKSLLNQSTAADPKTMNNLRERHVLEAHKIIKKLVHNGYPDAMFYLADCLSTGALGLENDPKEAFTLYLAAAKAGHPAAAYRTAVCCEIGPEEGGGTRKDPAKAVQWYNRAASLGDVPAMYKLGMILVSGALGQEANVASGAGWLKRAAERADTDNPHALHELGLLYGGPAQPGIIPDEAQAQQLFTKAAKLGYKFSQFKLGFAFEFGSMGCPIDSRQSIIWYTKAAAQGEHQSELALSGWYLTGAEGILEHSDSQAYLWARKAAGAEPPLPKAMFAMGYFTENGIGCKANLEEAKKWYGRAAAHRFPKAQERLEELKKGGLKAVQQKGREREKLTRNTGSGNGRKEDADCVLM